MKPPFLRFLGVVAAYMASTALTQVARVLGDQPKNTELAQSTDAVRRHFDTAATCDPLLLASNRLQVGASSFFKRMTSSDRGPTAMLSLAI